MCPFNYKSVHSFKINIFINKKLKILKHIHGSKTYSFLNLRCFKKNYGSILINSWHCININLRIWLWTLKNKLILSTRSNIDFFFINKFIVHIFTSTQIWHKAPNDKKIHSNWSGHSSYTNTMSFAYTMFTQCSAF